MNTSRIVCWFSCGVASAVATKLAIVENDNKLPLVVARCIVREEHDDNDRFADDCEEWFGVKITNVINEKYEGSIYKVFEKGYMSGVRGAACTLQLKKRVREQFELPTDIHVFGYCAGEESRFNKFIDNNNIEVMTPLIDNGLKHEDCLALVRDRGIEVPTMYKLGYKHNNCVGCVKASGQGYWNKIKTDFPVEFQKIADTSKAMGVRLIRVNNKRAYLDELVPGAGRYADEEEVQCGIFCDAAKTIMKDTNRHRSV